jgi:hypothetical protein
LPQVGVASGPGVLRGYVRVERAGDVELRVRVPRGARRVRAWVGGAAVSRRVVGGFVVFRAAGVVGGVTDWAVTWG